MAKVVFCNIAWMKFYSGITDNDQPKNGGAFVKENKDACESFNFYPYNHYCLGYVRAPGQRLNLARVEDVPDYVNKIDDVTVIWVATNDIGRHIVGWYEHAEMYRYYQEFYDSVNGEDRCWCYNFVASEKDVYLIPEELRNFRILSASKAGAGLGMGQSNLWYADSAITKEKFVPKVLEYLEKIRPQTIQQYWRKEFVEKIADIQGKNVEELNELAGSLIKNIGGGIAPTGGYVCGRADLVEKISYRLTAPSIGMEVGSYAYGYKDFYQGLFLAPHVVCNAIKTSLLFGEVFANVGYKTMPAPQSVCNDIIRSIMFDTEEELISFIRCIQEVSPIDSNVVPYPWDMPGYEDQVIMAAGTFVAGASIELSADSPIKAPYIAYVQGGLTYEHGKIAALYCLDKILSMKK